MHIIDCMNKCCCLYVCESFNFNKPHISNSHVIKQSWPFSSATKPSSTRERERWHSFGRRRCFRVWLARL